MGSGWKTQVGAGLGFLLMFLNGKFPGIQDALGPYVDDIAGWVAAGITFAGLIHKAVKAWQAKKGANEQAVSE